LGRPRDIGSTAVAFLPSSKGLGIYSGTLGAVGIASTTTVS